MKDYRQTFLFGGLSQLCGVCWLLTWFFPFLHDILCWNVWTAVDSHSVRQFAYLHGWIERQFSDRAVTAVTVLYIDRCGEIFNLISKVTGDVLNPLRLLFNCVCVQRWMTWLCIWTSYWQFLSKVPLVPLKEASAASGQLPKRHGKWCLWCTKPESSIYTVSSEWGFLDSHFAFAMLRNNSWFYFDLPADVHMYLPTKLFRSPAPNLNLLDNKGKVDNTKLLAFPVNI